MHNEIIVQLENVTRRYAGNAPAVDRVSLAVRQSALTVLLGPSGCGKTTTLRLIAGLEAPDHGTIRIGARVVAGDGAWVAPEARRVGLVFQEAALFPHLTIADNAGFALQNRPRAERRQRVAELLDLTGLGTFGDRYPHQLSGGQQQRAALARALAADPVVLLLDEPFSNLDAGLRQKMREEVRRIVRVAGVTTVMVTHDQEEALSIADVVAVMLAGQIEQSGAPQTVYLRPASRAIANFIGEANWLDGEADGETVACLLGQLPLAAPIRGPVAVLVRPEALVVSPDPVGEHVVETLTFYGHDQSARICSNGGPPLLARTLPDPAIVPGATVRVHIRGPVVAFPVDEARTAFQASVAGWDRTPLRGGAGLARRP
jgi:iron(III) transport system ATP-binding protein